MGVEVRERILGVAGGDGDRETLEEEEERLEEEEEEEELDRGWGETNSELLKESGMWDRL